MIRGRRKAERDGVAELLSETAELVSRLVRENRALKTRNLKLEREVERLTAGWDQIRRITRAAPRSAAPRPRRGDPRR